MTEATSPAASRASAFGQGLLLGSLAALLVAVLGAVRASGSGVGFVPAWVALGGASALWLGPCAGSLRFARPLSPPALALPMGLVLAAGPLAIFARVLKTTTHHRPLGAATFALVAAGLVLAAVALSARVLQGAHAGSRPKLWRAIGVGLVVAGGAVAGLTLLPAASAALRSSVLDGVLLLGLGAASAWAPVPERWSRVAPIVGGALWLVASAASLALLLGQPALRAALFERAPVLLGLTGLLGG